MEVKEPEIFPPKFAAELAGKTHVKEGQKACFACRVEPLHDPNLRIEFYHNGKALQSASRFHITFDFGYVSLYIQHCIPEDTGEYTVKAINALGKCTSAISMTVTATPSIISKCRWPQGLEKIRELESAGPVTSQRPVFTQLPITKAARKIKEAARLRSRRRAGAVQDTSDQATLQWLWEGALIPETPNFQMIHDGDNAVLLIGNTYEDDNTRHATRDTRQHLS